jgi:hypothetical protein
MFSQHASHRHRPSLQIRESAATSVGLDVVCQVQGPGRKIVFEGSIQHLARSGASLIVSRLPARGAELVLIIQRPHSGAPYRRTARLIHARAHRQREWLIACQFTELLSEEEIKDLQGVTP